MARGAGRSLPGFGSMVDKKISSARRAFYLRAGALDVIFSVGFDHELSEIFRFLGCLECRSMRSNRLKKFLELVLGKLVYFCQLLLNFLCKLQR